MNTLKVQFDSLPEGRTPILSYCRQLIQEGVDPKTRLEIYRTNDYFDVSVDPIEDGAKITVLEYGRGGPRFVKYRDRYPSDP